MTGAFRRTESGGPAAPETSRGGARFVPPVDWGRFERLEFVGRGGMGSVYSAWDPRLRRRVALKLLHDAADDAAERFLREARAQARVSHPNVCEVYEVDEIDGRPYVAMQLIQGEPLSRVAPSLERDGRIRILRDVARAAHAAHQQGLIHRDLKPSNVMVVVDERGVHRARVVDFGLSRPFLERRSDRVPAPEGARADGAGDASLTVRGEVAGTPSYMAPEQALGVAARLDARANVYSIGCTLYECLVGRPPHEADSVMELLLKVTSEEPVPPRSVDRTIPSDLDAVVMRCLRKDPAERYRSAEELADDLDAVLRRRPVRAYRGGPAYRVRTFVRRAPALSTAAAVLVAATVATTGMWLHTAWYSSRQAAAAHRLGAEVARLEGLLWRDRSLPVHDVRPTLEAVHQRVGDLEREVARAGPASSAPGELALGTALLALGDPDAAVVHLEEAWASGYAPADSAWALGDALGRLYRRGLAGLPGIADPELREAERQRLERELGDRTRDLLRRAAGTTSASPAHVASLLALHEGRARDGLELARAAFAEAPWQYEAKLLEGDLLAAVARGSGDDGEAARAATEAEACYLAAAGIAPSDPRCHVRLAQLRWERMFAHHPRPIAEEDWARAAAAVESALTVHPDDVEARMVASRLHLLRADQLRVLSLGDPWPPLEEAVSAAEAAVSAGPQRAEPAALLGEVRLTAAKMAAAAGRDPSGDLEAAVRSLSRAVETAPSYSGYNSLGVALRRTAAWEGSRGNDPSATLDRAAAAFTAATVLDPGLASAWSNLGWVELNRAQHVARRGGDPVARMEASVETFRRAVATDPDRPEPHNNLGMALCELAETMAWRNGGDRDGLFVQAAAALERAIELYPDYTFAHNNLGNLLLAASRVELAGGRDPSAQLERAEEALSVATRRSGYATAWFNLGLLEGLRGRLAAGRGEDPSAALSRARERFARGLGLRPGMAAALVEAAWVEAAIARASVGSGDDPGGALERCRRLAHEALEQDPTLGSAWTVLAAADLEEARWRGGDASSLESARRAVERAWELAEGDRETARIGLLVALAAVAGTSGGDSATARWAGVALERAAEARPSAGRDLELDYLEAMLGCAGGRAPGAGAGSSDPRGELRRLQGLNPFLRGWYRSELAALPG